MRGQRIWLVGVMLAAFCAACAPTKKTVRFPDPGDASKGSPSLYAPAASHKGVRRLSTYVTMRDGVLIAVDVLLPADLKSGERVPAMLQQTRYWRTPDIRFPFSLFADPLDHQGIFGTLKRRFLAHGYAWVDVDTRGSGASFGNRPWDYSPDEIQDGGEIASWIARQPWSDGKIVTAGASYTGSTAEFALINRHPAIDGVVTVSSEFDQYTDIIAPGGVPLTWWLDDWGALTKTLDEGRMPGADFITKLASGGVAPVRGDLFGLQRGAAIREHRDNYDFRELKGLVYRDDLSGVFAVAGRSPARAQAQARQFAWLERRFGPDFRARGLDLVSAHAYLDDLRARRTPVYAVAGWFDGTYANAAAKRFNTLGNPGDKLLIGPWDHTQHNIDPFAHGGPTRFDLIAELMKFADGHVGGKPGVLQGDQPVHYFVMGAETWRGSPSWPPRATPVRWFLDEGGALAARQPATIGSDPYRVDPTAGTGRATRFDTLTATALLHPYPDRASRDLKLLVHESAPLDRDLEVTGHPIANLWLASNQTDAAVFVYLEDVWPDGRVVYVTEGELRALHRNIAPGPSPTWQAGPCHSFKRADAQALVPGEAADLAFELLPTAYVFKTGHRIRIAIAGADADHFAPVPAKPVGTAEWQVYRGGARASWVELPVMTIEAGPSPPT